jgi:hypothetical protein
MGLMARLQPETLVCIWEVEVRKRKDTRMKCSICKGEIEVQGTWTEGHNAEPVVEDGRCCDHCNSTVVIPARLKLVNADNGI